MKVWIIKDAAYDEVIYTCATKELCDAKVKEIEEGLTDEDGCPYIDYGYTVEELEVDQ